MLLATQSHASSWVWRSAPVLITDRYHSLVFGAQMGTPAVALASTTHKSAGLLAVTGLHTSIKEPNFFNYGYGKSSMPARGENDSTSRPSATFRPTNPC